MAKILDLMGLEKAMSLQKEYIDKGDQKVRSSLEEYIKNQGNHSVDFNKLLTSSYKMADIDQKGIDNGFLDIFTNGDLDILDEWDPVLINTMIPDEVDGHTVMMCTKLMKNNFLRYEDGSFARVVGITQQQYDECMNHELYMLNTTYGTYDKFCDPGKFNSIKLWEKDKALIAEGKPTTQLYTMKMYQGNPQYTKIRHILRPWETTDTNYTIGIANHRTLYLLDNQKGKNGNWRGISTKPIKFDGIDFGEYALPPTAISPGPTVNIKVDGRFKARNFFYLYKADDNIEPTVDDREKLSFYEKNRTYPSVDDVTLTTISENARNNNLDKSKTYPFAEGGYLANNMFITALELAVGNRYMWSSEIFGSGISSVDPCYNRNSFFTEGGLRIKDEYTDWHYFTFDSIVNGELTENKPVNSLEGYLHKKWEECLVREQCMESQMAASMASELGIKPTTDPNKPNFFEFYGNKYYYMNVPGVKGLMEGRMNARVYKYIQKKVSKGEYNNINDKLTPVELVFRMSLFNGANLCGDVPVYKQGGLEIIGESNSSGKVTSLKVLAQFDQTIWHTEVTKELDVPNKFGFEDQKNYKQIISVGLPKTSYEAVASRIGYTPLMGRPVTNIPKGGMAISTGDCYVQEYDQADIIPDTRTRVNVLFGGYYEDQSCSPRRLNLKYDTENGKVAGSLQVLVKFNW